VMDPRLLVDGMPIAYEAQLHCTGLVRDFESGEIQTADRFRFGIGFPAGYLRHVDPLRVVSVVGPPNIWHPNILGPLCCVGHVTPGTELVDLLYQIYEIVTWQNWAAHDGLNQDACQWARHHTGRFPLDRRPLKRKLPGGAKPSAAKPAERGTREIEMTVTTRKSSSGT
jgi:hypothetical protein